VNGDLTLTITTPPTLAPTNDNITKDQPNAPMKVSDYMNKKQPTIIGGVHSKDRMD
jgi:hypothetical protein